MADDEDEPSAGSQYAVSGTQRRGEVGDVHQGELAGDPVEGLICARGEPLRIVNDIGDGCHRLRSRGGDVNHLAREVDAYNARCSSIEQGPGGKTLPACDVQDPRAGHDW
jgi:hypothetical protein